MHSYQATCRSTSLAASPTSSLSLSNSPFLSRALGRAVQWVFVLGSLVTALVSTFSCTRKINQRTIDESHLFFNKCNSRRCKATPRCWSETGSSLSYLCFTWDIYYIYIIYRYILYVYIYIYINWWFEEKKQSGTGAPSIKTKKGCTMWLNNQRAGLVSLCGSGKWAIWHCGWFPV